MGRGEWGGSDELKMKIFLSQEKWAKMRIWSLEEIMRLMA